MLLSIVMMVKNEEKHLEKTLSALNRLKKEINSELVILDTGSTDKSIEIANKYTDKVYCEIWNDNFADMRNKSIKYASGDWIFILDADEELLNCEKMITFFNSELCEKYNSASIELKSIVDENCDVYTKASIPRLFKKSNDFGYVGAIHEQPLLKEPMYNDIACFNHYGYMYENEEIKIKKIKRNEKILLSEYKKDPNNPYTCYQLARNYDAYEENKEALYFMEKSYNVYKSKNITYIPTESSLARIYLKLKKYENCKKMCLEYINRDDKNIDIYFYLILAQKNLKEYDEVLKTYSRYIYLIKNYEISTQANEVTSLYETASMEENIKLEMIDVYYNLEKYEEVLTLAKNIRVQRLKSIYFIVFSSLYELGREDEIIDIYKYNKSLGEEQSLRMALEEIILNIKQSDREKMYDIASNFMGNYGVLNEVRLGKKLLIEDYNCILAKENDSFYGDLIYFALEDKIDIYKILHKVNYFSMDKYIEYIVQNRRECILKLYNYLISKSNTLDIQKIRLYSIIAKQLLLFGNLKDEKCKKLFFMYISYRYEYLKQLYNVNLTDKDIVQFASDKDDIFVIDIINLQNTKNIHKLEYIKTLKNILIENNKYSEAIQILITEFENELNENEELRQLKKQYKSIIENNIQTQNLDVAISMIDEYESIFDSDNEILNMKAIIQMMKQNFEEAEITLKNGFILNNSDYNTIFNIAYLKECTNEIDEALRFYTKIVNNCKEEEIVLEAKEKIFLLNRIDYI